MIGFAEIAATAPSDVTGMTRHLLNNTLGKDSALAAYYNRGGEGESHWFDLAEQVISGGLERGAAVDLLMEPWHRTWYTGDEAAFHAAQAAYADRLDKVIDQIEGGLAHAPLGIVRPDIEACVMIGLGLRPGMLLGEDEINNLLAGRRVDGEKIEGKHYAAERRRPVNEKTGERTWSTPIGSYDFCPTPDKSVSVAWAFASDVERARIFQAHIEAAREAVGHIGDAIGVARYGDGGQGGREAGAVGWIEFTHHTSRRVQIVTGAGVSATVEDGGIAGDMNLHTHFLIPNAVFTPSGKVGSLDTMGIRGLIFEADGLYHARLGTKLRDAGFDVALDHDTGAARMTVVPDAVRTHFSKKTNIGEQAARKEVADAGLDWDRLSESERNTRVKEATQRWEVKQKGSAGAKDDVANFADWRRQAKEEVGWSIPDSLQLIGPPLRALTQAERHRTAYEMGLAWLAQRFEHEAVLSHYDLRRAALRGLVHTGMSDMSDVNAVTKIMREDGVRQYGEQTPLVWGREDGQRFVSVTTALHESDEQDFVRLAKDAASDRSAAIPTALLKRKIDGSGLDFTDAHGQSQRDAIERIGTGGRFGVILAAAGAGKTAALQPLTASWKEMGRDVYGASLAWRQADDLVEAGIDKRNVFAVSVMLDRFGFGLPDGEGPPPLTLTKNSVVAVDEWGLLGTRQGLELLRWQQRMGFSIVAFGDEKQCQSIQAGAIIDLTRKALGAGQIPEILTTKRQATDREKQIVGLLRDGRAAEALAMKREDGTAEMAYGGREGVIKRVAEIYTDRLKAGGHAPTISAPTNLDAHQISAAVREERRKLGMIGADITVVAATDGTQAYGLALAAGDRVRLFKSTGADFGNKRGGSIGRNGSVLEVVDADPSGLVLRAKTGKVGTVAWDTLRPNGSDRVQLAYGDCLTIHSAQGTTAQEHIFALPSGSGAVTGYSGYSAATRHKSVSYLVTSESAERIAVRESRPLNDPHDVTTDDKWAVVAKRLSLQPEKETAIDMIVRAANIGRGTVRAFHDMKTPADPRLRPRTASQAPQVVQNRRLDLSVMRQVFDVARGGPARVARSVVQRANDLWRAQRPVNQPEQRPEPRPEPPKPRRDIDR